MERTFKPVRSLVVYEADRPGMFMGTSHYVTVHDFQDGQMCEGRPITREALTELCATVMPSINSTVSFLPPELLAYTPSNERGLVAWWSPPAVRTLYFDSDTGIPSGPAPVPGCVFMVRGRKLSVWALEGVDRPTPQTRLYQSPFFNVSGGSVCLGNMKKPRAARPADIEGWEQAFWMSAFTHEGGDELKGIKPHTLWKGLVNSGRKKFPVKHLKPYGKTVGKILED